MCEKVMLVIDMPSCCRECPFKYESEKVPLGNYVYQVLFRCKYEPDTLCSDDDIYLDVISDNKKSNWCPLKPVPKKLGLSNRLPMYDTDTHYEQGYNDCIDKIMEK